MSESTEASVEAAAAPERLAAQVTFAGRAAERVRAEAEAQGLTVAQTVRRFVEDYISVRDSHLAALGEGPGEPLAARAVHSMLASVEKRVAGTVGRAVDETASLRSEVAILTAAVDALTMLYLLHTPRVPADELAGAQALAQQRYEKFVKQVSRRLEGGSPALAQAVFDEQESE